MSKELDEAQERGRIETIGLEHIRIALGYDEGKLSLTTTRGMELAYEMGLIVCVGIEDSQALLQQRAELLGQAKDLIARNEQGAVFSTMDMSGP